MGIRVFTLSKMGGQDHPFVKEGRFASLRLRDREVAESLVDGFNELWRKAMPSLRQIAVDPRRAHWRPG
jgi:hypothetical protein